MNYLKTLNEWQNKKTKDLILKKQLKKTKDKYAEELFNKKLNYSHKGINAEVGVGTNKLNEWTMSAAAYAFAKFLLQNTTQAMTKGIVVSFDNRINGEFYSDVVVRVLNAMGFKAYVFQGNNMQPTPLLSYTIKKMKAAGGINITSVLDKSKYNGFQAYDATGAKLGQKQSKKLSSLLNQLNVLKIEQGDFKPKYISDEIIKDYIQDISAIRIRPNDRRLLKVAVSALHGSTHLLAPKILQKIDISYKTVKSLNKTSDKFSEFNHESIGKQVLYLAHKTTADIAVALNSNGTKMTVVAKTKFGKYKLVSPEVLSAIILKYKIQFGKFKGAVIQTNKTSHLITSLANRYKLNNIVVNDMFRTINDEIQNQKSKEIFGISGNDKLIYSHKIITESDVLQNLMIIVEVANYLKTQGKTLFEDQQELFEMFGIHRFVHISKKLDEKSIKLLFSKILKKKIYKSHQLEKAEALSEDLIKVQFDDGTWFTVEKELNGVQIMMEIIGEDQSYFKENKKSLTSILKKLITEVKK